MKVRDETAETPCETGRGAPRGRDVLDTVHRETARGEPACLAA